MALHQFDEREAARLEKQYAIPVIVEQRRRTLAALNAHTGERILDIGSGPGYLTEEIARIVGPQGNVCAVDMSEPMIDAGRRRCAAYPMVEFRRANAGKLPYKNASFDAAVGVQVYLYVPELGMALAELWRVLRPGGRAIVVDTDWGTIVWNSQDPARMSRVLETWKRRYFNAHIGRVLPGALRRAGFVIDAVETIGIVELSATDQDYSGHQLNEVAKYVSGSKGDTASEAAAWKQEQRELEKSGDYFFSLNRYLVVAHRQQCSN